jgi:hypothetical protein
VVRPLVLVGRLENSRPLRRKAQLNNRNTIPPAA